VNGLRLALAFLRRDVRIELSYRANLAFGLVGGFAMLMTFYFVGETVGGGAPALARHGGGYFAFAVIGVAATGPLHAALLELARRVREAQLAGTLEAVLATPVGPTRAIAYSALYPLASSCVRMALLVGGGALVFDLPVVAAGIPAALAVLAVALAGYGALGLLSAAFTLRYQRGDPIAFMLDMVSVLLGGVFFPVEVLPAPLRAASRFLPATHALEALRRVLLDGAGLREVAPSLGALALFAAIAAPIAYLAFRYAIRRAKDDGSLTQY
jgi:ABC-2 type transport system permease protein